MLTDYEGRLECLVVTDEPVVRDAVLRLVLDVPSGRVSACDTLEAARLHLPSGAVVLVDAVLVGSSFGAFVSEVADREGSVVVFRGSGHVADFERAFRAGIRGYLERTCTPDDVLAGLRDVAAGRRHVPAALALAVAERFVTGVTGGRFVRLTDRERDVLRLAARGLRTREIGAELIVSHRTVKTHLDNAYEKLDAPNRAAAVARATELGLLDHVS